MGKESFAENINIYYSCLIVLYSIIPFVFPAKYISIINLVLTVLLTISIVYIKSLKYKERARDYRKNYTDLQKLEFRLSHEIADEELKSIENEYCDLLASAENHIPFDYYKTIMESRGSFQTDHLSKTITRKYYWGCIWRILIKFCIVLLPLILAIISFLVN